MKKIKSYLFRPVFLLSAAAVLLAMSALGSARAALTYYSENYSAEVTVSSIGVSLMENGQRVSYRDYEQGGQWNEGTGQLLQDLTEEGEAPVPGKAYPERLSAQNSGQIDTYVRMILYRDWENPEGRRDNTLSPALIDLELSSGQGWLVDEKASTQERTVLYYSRILPPGQETPSLSDTLTISSDVAKKARETVATDDQGYKSITTSYLYDGYRFNLTAEVDAVQTHNAQDAIKSAWGADVNVAEDGTLSLQ